MKFIFVSIFLLCCLFSLEYVQAGEDTDSADCKFWNQLAKNLSDASLQRGNAVHLGCNSTCTQLTCSGHLKQQLFGTASLDLDFCFGVKLNHCDSPVSMDYYLDVPDKDISKFGSVSHNSTLDIPGPTAGPLNGTFVVVVEMVRVNSTHILFGVTGKLRVSLGGISDFPYSQKVFPPTYIDVPPCTDKSKVKTPFKAPSVCTPPAPQTSLAPPVTVTAKVLPVNGSKTYNKSCEFGVAQCGQTEMCAVRNDRAKAGICVCESAATFNWTTGFCTSHTTPKMEASSTAGPSVTVAKKLNGGKEKTVLSKTALIIGAAFGGLLLIVVVVSIIIFLGRRRRQTFYHSQHHLLTNDDDDDTNVVI